MIITDNASRFILNFLAKHSSDNPDKHICQYDFKIIIENSGCNGKKYSLYPITVVEICDDGLLSINFAEFHVWFKKEDKSLIEDITIDLEKDLFGTKISITNKSISTISCGCGKSFTLG